MKVAFHTIQSLVQALLKLASAGKAILKDLKVTKVYDLRSDTEIRKYDAPFPKIEGVDVVHIPVFQTADYSPEMMAKCVRAVNPTDIYILPYIAAFRRYQLYASGKTEVRTKIFMHTLI